MLAMSRSLLAALLGVALSSACGTYGEVDTYDYKDADGGRPKPGIGIGTVQVAFNRCPEVTSMTVTPLVTGVGGLVTMTATAEDPEGDEVSLAWSVSEGEILARDDELSTYECETIGFPTVTLEVSDESGCTRANSVVLGCVATP